MGIGVEEEATTIMRGVVVVVDMGKEVVVANMNRHLYQSE